MKPLFENIKLPQKTRAPNFKDSWWTDRKMILEIFCGYHEDKGFKAVFTKREYRKLMFGSGGVENKTMRHIYETAIKFDKNPPALAWKMIKLNREELKKKIT
jgi:hypothetical protein